LSWSPLERDTCDKTATTPASTIVVTAICQGPEELNGETVSEIFGSMSNQRGRSSGATCPTGQTLVGCRTHPPEWVGEGMSATCNVRLLLGKTRQAKSLSRSSSCHMCNLHKSTRSPSRQERRYRMQTRESASSVLLPVGPSAGWCYFALWKPYALSAQGQERRANMRSRDGL